MYWTKKDIENGDVQLVRLSDGRLFSILPDKNKQEPTYALGDEFGVIEGNPQQLIGVGPSFYRSRKLRTQVVPLDVKQVLQGYTLAAILAFFIAVVVSSSSH